MVIKHMNYTRVTVWLRVNGKTHGTTSSLHAHMNVTRGVVVGGQEQGGSTCVTTLRETPLDYWLLVITTTITTTTITIITTITITTTITTPS